MAIRQDFLESSNQSPIFDKIFTRLESLVEDLRDDSAMTGWTQTGGENVGLSDLVSTSEEQLRRRSRLVYLRNPHGKGVIRTLVKFVIGAGFLVDFTEEDKPKNKKLLKWWRKVKKKVKFIRFIREFVTRAFRDGEVFVRRFKPSEITEDIISKVRFIDPDDITNIKTEEEDVETVVAYLYKQKLRDGTFKEITVPAEDVCHCKINVDSNIKRGRPFLEPILPLLAKYDKWLEARMLLNIVRTSIALVQEVTGPSTDLFRLRNAQTSNRGNQLETDKAKMVRPGTILRGIPGVKYNMLSPNLDAKDASEDGRTILLGVATGSGMPDIFVTSDYQHSNFAATVVAQNPAIREFEDWQLYFSESFVEIIAWFVEDGIESGELDKSTDEDFDITFPPLLQQNVGQETLANQAMWQAGVLSRRTWALKQGLDPDDEKEQIELDGGPPVQQQAQGTDRPRPNDGKPQLGQTNSIPKGVSDRNPRQNVKAGESVEEVEIPKKRKKEKESKVVVVNVKGEGQVLKPFTLEYESQEQDNGNQ